ncbi:hypothetical protein DFH06DRAFT_1474666 [Mycena polygramma]|nr:hypothetical protein DFH06DRAFT_1474666 [Mycena polygramma]
MERLFAVQELVDYIIHFLRDSRLDLKTCALVYRTWLYPAQSHLFRKIGVSINRERVLAPENLWPRLLNLSPHLNRHIRQLDLVIASDGSGSTCAAVWELGGFPFMHLKRVHSALALQQLLNLPTVVEVRLMSTTVEPKNFLDIFQRCSPAIKHLDLYFSGRTPLPVLPLSRTSKVATLTTLSVQSFRPIIFDRHLLFVLHPFTLANLRALRISASPIEWLDLAPAMKALEILGIYNMNDHRNIDLTAFPNLHLLHIRVDSMSPAETTMNLLSSITRASHLRTLILQLSLIDPQQLTAVCSVFDQALSNYPGLTVELEYTKSLSGLEVTQAQVDQVVANFPHLSAKKMLRSVPYNPSWWEMSPSFISTIRTAMKRSKSTRTAPIPITCNYTPPMRPTPAVMQPQLRTSPSSCMLDDECVPPTPDVLILRSFRRMSYTQTARVHEPLW